MIGPDPRTSLRKLFSNEVRRSRCNGNGPRIFLELFGGTGRVSKALSQKGYGAINFEISEGGEFDLLDSRVVNLIEGWIKGGCIAGFILETPCTS